MATMPRRRECRSWARSAVRLDPKSDRNRFDAVGIARDVNGLLRLIVAPHRAAQPDGAVGVGVDPYVRQALEVLRRELRLDPGRDDRVLDEGGGVPAIGIDVRGIGNDRSQRRSDYEAGSRKFACHDHPLRFRCDVIILAMPRCACTSESDSIVRRTAGIRSASVIPMPLVVPSIVPSVSVLPAVITAVAVVVVVVVPVSISVPPWHDDTATQQG